MLELMFEHQRQLQRDAFVGGDPSELNLEQKIQYIKDMVLAATDELHEALAEVGWKPWSTRREIDRDPYVGELVDVQHFVLNLLIAVGVTPEEFFGRYTAKAAVNQTRQDAGYDDSMKCSVCRRALDEPGAE